MPRVWRGGGLEVCTGLREESFRRLQELPHLQMNVCAAESEEWQKAYIKLLLYAFVNIYLKCKYKIIWIFGIQPQVVLKQWNQLEVTSQVIIFQLLSGDDVLIVK